jgi:hypothetical protein
LAIEAINKKAELARVLTVDLGDARGIKKRKGGHLSMVASVWN